MPKFGHLEASGWTELTEQADPRATEIVPSWLERRQRLLL